MKIRKSKASGKRGFKTYASPMQAGWNKPGGGGEPGDPYELSMYAVRLRERLEPFGMDEGRKRAQRRMLWYWRHSRDWQGLRVRAACAIEPEKMSWTAEAPQTEHPEQPKATWYWRGTLLKRHRRKKSRNKLTHPAVLISGRLLAELATKLHPLWTQSRH